MGYIYLDLPVWVPTGSVETGVNFHDPEKGLRTHHPDWFRCWYMIFNRWLTQVGLWLGFGNYGIFVCVGFLYILGKKQPSPTGCLVRTHVSTHWGAIWTNNLPGDKKVWNHMVMDSHLSKTIFLVSCLALILVFLHLSSYRCKLQYAPQSQNYVNSHLWKKDNQTIIFQTTGWGMVQVSRICCCAKLKSVRWKILSKWSRRTLWRVFSIHVPGDSSHGLWIPELEVTNNNWKRHLYIVSITITKRSQTIARQINVCWNHLQEVAKFGGFRRTVLFESSALYLRHLQVIGSTQGWWVYSGTISETKFNKSMGRLVFDLV